MHPTLFDVGEGIRLSACRTDRFKSGLLSVNMILPVSERSACLAPLLLSVLRRGTERYPTMADINRRLEYLWGTGFTVRSSHRGGVLVLGFTAELLDAAYLPKGAEDLTDAAAELIREILFCPLLDADGLLSAKYVESEKQQQRDAIRALKNNPGAYAAEQCRAQMYAGTPCGIPQYGTEEQTMAVTREELTAFWRELTAAFCPECFYIGPADGELIAQKLARVFGNCRAPSADHTATVCLPRPGKPRNLELSMPVTQSRLVMGLQCGVRVGDGEELACMVLNELLGNSPVSRLFVYVREKLSLCYSCSSVYASFTGALLISCGLSAENRRRAEREIEHQLRVLREGKFEEFELIAAKRSLQNAYMQLSDSPAELENFFLTARLSGVSRSPEQLIAGITAVTAEDVRRVAGKLMLDTVCFLEGTLAGDGGEEDEDEALL